MNPLQALYEAGLTSPEMVQQAQRAKALQDLYALRQAGMSDDQILDLGRRSASGMNLAGGTEIANLANQNAGITAGYSLGRAGMAADREQNRFQNAVTLATLPKFNAVSYLDALARTGTAVPLNNPILENIQPMFTPPGMQDEKLGDWLDSDKPEPYAGGGMRMIDRPSVLVDAYTGRPTATFAENGPEMFGVHPMPGVSRRLGRGRQDAILDAAVGPDRRYSDDDVEGFAGGTYFGFNTPQEAQRFAQATSGATAAQRQALSTMAGSSPSRYTAAPARTWTGQPIDTNNAIVRRTSTGQLQIDTSQQAGQGRAVTPAELAEYNSAQRQRWLSGAGQGWSRTPTPGQQAKANAALEWVIDNQMKYGRVPLGADAGKGDPYKYARSQRSTTTGSTPQGMSVPKGEKVTPVDAGANNAQQATAKLIGAVQGNSYIPPEFTQALQAGKVPAIGLLTPRAWRAMTPSMRAIYASLLESTGWVGDVSDIDDAIERNRPA